MTPLDPHLLGVAIRWVHVTSTAGLLGGALLLWGLAARPDVPRTGEHDRLLLIAAEIYERLFWAAVGLLIMTGVGNLGAFSAALPGRQTAWGETLLLKLLAVAIFLLASLIRTLLITYLSTLSQRAPPPIGWRLLRASYAGTALFAAAVLGVAVSLAHG